ncbi:MAG TPA: RNA polymerase sigma factor region1.1 domain-containing protein, partial [Alphaproteobacteria bacterium]|nr:RNA polymerase sigma factor region1.1 domain-containing protein [Alphaproteobacteria bacterium]
MSKQTVAATEEAETREETSDSPLLDTVGAAVKGLIAKGRERGHITYDELNTVLPPEKVSSEQIEDTMAMISELGINLVEDEETEESQEKRTEVATTTTTATTTANAGEADLGRTDDPVRMYLREMGSVELLSREGEIAIAKRIVAGREVMIGAMWESPLTLAAIKRWYGAIKEEHMLLREVIDLEATYVAINGGPEVNPDSVGTEGAVNGNGAIESAVAETTPDEANAANGGDAEFNGKDGEAAEGAGNSTSNNDNDSDSDEVTLSLSGMEELLKPIVMDAFKAITKSYAKLERIHDQR